MATYIGKAPVNGFHTKQTLSSDGSTTTFTLDTTVATESSIIVSVGGIIQEPGVAYNLAQGGTKITFTGAPAATDTVYIQYLGQTVSQTLTDLNGTSLILDDDQDTTIGASTDDQILFTVGGTANATYKTTGVHNPDSIKFVAGTGDDMQMYHDGSNSYLTNSTGALKLATETSGIAITIGHTTSEVTVADNLTVGGDLTVTGTTSFNDTNITNVGSIALDTITNDGTNITLDSSGDIILDADGGDVFFKDATTTIATFSNTSSDFVITTGVQDKDFIVKGDDGGSAITALTIDMSEAGAATFNNKIVATELDISGNVDIDGTLETDALSIASTTVTSTAAELNKLDGVGTLAQAGKQTIWVPANAMVPTKSNGCAALATVETTSGRPDMNVLDFDKDSDEFAQFSVAFPKSWDAGTVTFQFFWSGLAATTGVAMNLQGVAFADNDSIDTAYGTAVVVQDDAQGAVEELLVSAESGNITIAGSPGANELTYFRVGRDVSDGNDDMAGDCRLHGVKLFFTTNAANDA